MSAEVIIIIKELLDASGVEYADVAASSLAGQTIYTISAPDSGHALVGHGGDVIHAIDMLVKKIAEKHAPVEAVSEGVLDDGSRGMFLVDVNDYRTKQIKDLQSRALIMAERARSFQYDVELSPMTAYERLIVHTTLADASNIKTESQGEGRNRRVVIKYAA